MDDGLVLVELHFVRRVLMSLNPYCNGRWSRTFAQVNEELDKIPS